MIRPIIIFLILFSSITTVIAADDALLLNQRQEFLALEKLVNKKKAATEFLARAEKIKDYPLYPYLYYQWLKTNLSESAKVKNYLLDYKKTRYPQLLRKKWLMYLAKEKQWREFVDHYQGSNNVKMQCHYADALYRTGAKKQALLAAKKLWVVGHSQPGECDAVFKVLKKSSYFTREMLWQRFAAAMVEKHIAVARYVKDLMNKKDQKVASLWLKINSSPALVENPKNLDKKLPQAGLIFAHGIDRLASNNLSKAIQVWDSLKNKYTIDLGTSQRIEKRLAMSLAYRGEKDAYHRLSQLVRPDEKTKEWRVRAALRGQDWNEVAISLSELNKETKEKDKWRYWQARALEKTEKSKVASFIYSKLSKERSFYGYLAAEKQNKDYQLGDNPILVAPEMYKRLKNTNDFRAVAELIAVDKPREAKRQWWYAVRKLDKKRIMAAAKYAQELNWKQVAIFTLAKAKYWDDVGLRFPLAYKTQVEKNAELQQLNPAVIFGLIRRESAFDKNARSPVGARGLMQIMPKTGKQIARELNEKWKSTSQLMNPLTNVKYGAYYYKKLLKQFDGHYALAAAAYNAGPHRVKRWLPAEKAMAADIWIETIPFNETRAYVSSVLTYALIYQQKLKQNVLTMKDFMRDVFPG